MTDDNTILYENDYWFISETDHKIYAKLQLENYEELTYEEAKAIQQALNDVIIAHIASTPVAPGGEQADA